QTFPPGHADRIREAIGAEGGRESVMEVRCHEVNKLLRAHRIHSVDFLSLDTEGGEYDLLRALDLRAFHAEAITVENNHHDRRIEHFLTRNGYQLVACMGCDEIYAQWGAGR